MSLKTAESVCIGHPDKLCDLICETILSNILFEDPAARVAVEAAAKGRHIYIFGEITTKTRLYLKEWTRKALSKAGYNPRSFHIHLNITRQSADIDYGVTQSHESRTTQDKTAHALLGAGDQGTVYGYATNETKEYLPAPLVIAHNICRRLDEARTKGLITGIRSDGKAQVTIRYDKNNQPAEVTAIVVSVQHLPSKKRAELTRELRSLVIGPALGDIPLAEDAIVLINPAGPFITGGPEADSGLSGRKLAVDTYGGLGPHGGGAFAGKDPSKVDRTAALMARHIARSLVETDSAQEATVAISYAIGKADPVAFTVNTHGTGILDDNILTEICASIFPLRPSAMIEFLDLRRWTHYNQAGTYGYFTTYSIWETYSHLTRALRKEVQDRAHPEFAHLSTHPSGL